MCIFKAAKFGRMAYSRRKSDICHRSLQNQPAGVESKTANPRCFIHTKFLNASKGLLDFFTSAGAAAAGGDDDAAQMDLPAAGEGVLEVGKSQAL